MRARPNFLEMARAWLVRAQGHARVEHEKSLGAELESAWDLGIANAIEVVAALETAEFDNAYTRALEAAEAAVRKLTDKPPDPRGN